jgi:flagellar hook-associated protein 1 FlgK
MSFSGINLATRALETYQHALEITGQNITNVNTPGYSRQVPITRAVPPAGTTALEDASTPRGAGAGVELAVILRAHAAWLDRSAAQVQAQTGQATVADRYATQVENLLAEPTDRGLQSVLDTLFDAFGALSSRPDDLAARDAAVRAGAAVGARFTELTGGLDRLRGDVMTQAEASVGAINQLTSQVAGLSRQIRAAQASGGSPNELLDQRDQLLGELSRRAGAVATSQQDGELVVTIGGTEIVQGDHATALALASGPPLGLVAGGESVAAPGGELGAELELANTTLPDYRSRLTGVRDALAGAVNALHQSGTDLTGAPGEAFFVPDTSGNLVVNPALAADPRRVAAGTGAASDGSIARRLGDLRTAAESGVPAYRTFVAEIGAGAREDRQALQQSQATLQQIQGMQASESGVNLDEELAQMVSLQHAYAASARLLSVYDEMLSTLIQRTGA